MLVLAEERKKDALLKNRNGALLFNQLFQTWPLQCRRIWLLGHIHFPQYSSHV